MTGRHSMIPGRIQENLVAYFRQFAGLPGIISADGDVTWFVSEQSAPGRQVLRARLAAEEAERRIDEVLEEVGRHTAAIDWLVFPGCEPADLGQRLERRGMPGGPGGTWMLADPASAPRAHVPPNFRVERVRDPAGLDAWRRLSAAGFGGDVDVFYDAYLRHGFRDDSHSLQYIGYDGDVAVTSATLLLAGGIAGIFDLSTPPGFRRRGFGAAITAALLDEARQRGYADAWLWSSDMGRSVYERVGFTAVDLGIREYLWRKAPEL